MEPEDPSSSSHRNCICSLCVADAQAQQPQELQKRQHLERPPTPAPPMPPPHELQRTTTLTEELEQLRQHVDATNTHIHDLETIFEDQTRDQIVDIKRGLTDAHRGLEKLEERFVVVGELRKQVWQAYRRLRDFEEKMERGETMSIQDLSIAAPRAVQVVPAVRTASVANPGPLPVGETAQIVTPEERFVVPETFRSVKRGSHTPGSDVTEELQARIVPVGIPTRSHTISEARRSPRRRESGAEQKRRSEPVPAVHRWTDGIGRGEVLARVGEEERRGESKDGRLELHDADRRRLGSSDGWQVTQAVMTANDEPWMVVPQLAYVKIHEVRGLKAWLASYGYVRSSRRRQLGRMEKLLHLLTLMQFGCRYESVAVLFSRTPREVLSACEEVFAGLLEMHSETMLPRRSVSKLFIYPHLWRIARAYEREEENGPAPYVWRREDVYKVLITLNMYIGRYRSQGGFALDGECLDWGRYIQVDQETQQLGVVSWLERLQYSRR
ncbi:hypothetical protein M011DRAFT_529449 [Sporormia fimetaria CBS 119925]|uniref:Uncharacterized protein n=1 Tax=Sporormia fimetaria CBS 119925 TaxID=1340428 RepID=A0A6A6UXN9_9PLEO|nr:hypothetical protein M011DRAFT_529449 [Sporormia fimetaria CBS 119925]